MDVFGQLHISDEKPPVYVAEVADKLQNWRTLRTKKNLIYLPGIETRVLGFPTYTLDLID
jgi:hypothetical protein